MEQEKSNETYQIVKVSQNLLFTQHDENYWNQSYGRNGTLLE